LRSLPFQEELELTELGDDETDYSYLPPQAAILGIIERLDNYIGVEDPRKVKDWENDFGPDFIEFFKARGKVFSYQYFEHPKIGADGRELFPKMRFLPPQEL